MQMTDGRCRTEWQQTALLACLIANPNRDTKAHPKPFTVDEFNPYVVKKKEVLPAMKPSQVASMMFK
jgi:hypothetical protein